MRNPETTRNAILTAARAEFAAVGRAGARVDRIAAAAGVNKRMIYHYFGDKDGLCDELLRQHGRPAIEASAHQSGRIVDRLNELDVAFADAEGVRLLMWEALDGGRVPREPTAADAREPETWAALDRRQLELALMSLALVPKAFPRLVLTVVGMTPDDPAFVVARSAFMRAAIERLEAPGARAAKVKVRLRPNVIDR